MAIYLIDTLKQKNNQSFPIADVNDLKGGFYQVDTIEERNIIPQSRIREGMLCFVKQSPNHWYQYLEGIGLYFKSHCRQLAVLILKQMSIKRYRILILQECQSTLKMNNLYTFVIILESGELQEEVEVFLYILSL